MMMEIAKIMKLKNALMIVNKDLKEMNFVTKLVFVKKQIEIQEIVKLIGIEKIKVNKIDKNAQRNVQWI